MPGVDWSAVTLTLKLATLTTLILLVVSTPLAWHLAHTRGWWRGAINAVVNLPFVLPPTVLGFYLLVLMGPKGPVGSLCDAIGVPRLPFTFYGLLVASVIYSLPFVVQPLQNAFEAIGKGPVEAAATLRASPLDTFFSVIVPMAKSSYITAIVMGFAHTVGEFGVVMMIGGDIPDETRVLSVTIYDHVESLEFTQAHYLSAGLLAFSFVVLLLLYLFNPNKRRR
ncbi:MAG: molybdate ABC transporter permease subunit [Oxalobacter sp.]|nr:molybdate ABC transporter permease subunit [Oxalobacter sp.]